MTTEQRVAGRDLDSEIATKVMGFDVVGRATCVYVEGEWSVHVDSDSDGWACHAEDGPVYVEHCVCDHGPLQIDEENGTPRRRRESGVDSYNARSRQKWEADRARFGHSRSCLAVVPPYSESLSDAFAVVEKLRGMLWGLSVDTNNKGSWDVIIQHTSVDAHGVAVDESLPFAICRAALKALEHFAAASSIAGTERT